MNYYIGVDAGGTKTSAVSYDEVEVKRYDRIEGPGNLSVNWQAAVNNILGSIKGICQLETDHTLCGIAIGAAGLPEDRIDEMSNLVKELYNVPVVVVSDYELAFKSIFNEDKGILLIAGTGVVQIGKYRDKELKAGGWGHLLGDEGSGYDIVIRSLKKAIDIYEQSGIVPSVLETIMSDLNIVRFDAIKTFVYNNEKSAISAYAPIIIKAAIGGDTFSRSVVDEVTEILYSKLLAMYNHLAPQESLSYSLMGGVLNAKSLIAQNILKKVEKDGLNLSFVPPKDPSQAAVKLIKQERIEKRNYAVGLMSGTSLDGIDAVLCRIGGKNMDTSVDIIDFHTYPYSPDVLSDIEKMVSGEAVKLLEVSTLNTELGYAYADAVKRLCKKNKVDPRSLAFIASHGQTVFHEAEGGSARKRSTLQLGNPAILAYETGSKVISDFRSKDIAARGEGAPLVPYTELILYKDEHSNVLLNIGGICNLTYIPSSGNEKEIVGYDTGPGNMMINEAMAHFYALPFDNEGKIASQGELVSPMLEELMNHWFISKSAPKSTGRDEFGKDFTLEIINKYIKEKPEDIVHTLTAFTAHAVTKHVKEIIQKNGPVDRLIASGGGIHNKQMLSILSKLLSEVSVDVLTQEELGYSSDAKEAVAFVILGNQTLHKEIGNLPSVTGAERAVVLGSITYPD